MISVNHMFCSGGCYLHRIEDEWVADATSRGGCARFINHSCDPNCYTRIFSVEGVSKIGIYAKRTIYPGEELAYDYKVSEAAVAFCLKSTPCTDVRKNTRKGEAMPYTQGEVEGRAGVAWLVRGGDVLTAERL